MRNLRRFSYLRSFIPVLPSLTEMLAGIAGQSCQRENKEAQTLCD